MHSCELRAARRRQPRSREIWHSVVYTVRPENTLMLLGLGRCLHGRRAWSNCNISGADVNNL